MGWWIMFHYWEIIPHLHIGISIPDKKFCFVQDHWSIDIEIGWLFVSYDHKWEF